MKNNTSRFTASGIQVKCGYREERFTRGVPKRLVRIVPRLKFWREFEELCRLLDEPDYLGEGVTV